MAEQKEKKKDGVSIKELEGFVSKHAHATVMVALFVFAAIFGLGITWSCFWSILLTGAGAVLGVCFQGAVHKVLGAVVHFVLRQEKSTQLVLAGVAVIFSILLSPLIFLLIGLEGGKGLYARLTEGKGSGSQKH